MDTVRKPSRSFRLSDVAIAVALVIGIPALLLYNGFGVCWGGTHTKIGFLSNEKAIEAAIDEVINSIAHVRVDPNGQRVRFITNNQIAYHDRDEFRRINPDCCKIVPHNRFEVSRWHELFGLANKSVHVAYRVRYPDDDGNIVTVTAVTQRAITNCGRVMYPGY